MDPDANLAEQLRIVERIVAAFNGTEPVEEFDAARLAELVLALDGWIRGGGFLPAAWRR